MVGLLLLRGGGRRERQKPWYHARARMRIYTIPYTRCQPSKCQLPNCHCCQHAPQTNWQGSPDARARAAPYAAVPQSADWDWQQVLRLVCQRQVGDGVRVELDPERHDLPGFLCGELEAAVCPEVDQFGLPLEREQRGHLR
eukprot:scaffold2379_cov124-Isochrysis_galbana.AAC.5